MSQSVIVYPLAIFLLGFECDLKILSAAPGTQKEKKIPVIGVRKIPKPIHLLFSWVDIVTATRERELLFRFRLVDGQMYNILDLEDV